MGGGRLTFCVTLYCTFRRSDACNAKDQHRSNTGCRIIYCQPPAHSIKEAMGWIKSKVKSTPRGSKKGSAAKEAEAAAAQKEKEEAAALKVQSLSRGNSGRKVSQTKKEEKQTKEEQDAVTKMQAAARGGQRGGCPQPSRARRSCRPRRRMTAARRRFSRRLEWLACGCGKMSPSPWRISSCRCRASGSGKCGARALSLSVV